MADDGRLQDVINSPWLQLGVPLAATAATAIAPRHSARTAAMALGGLRTINQYGDDRARLQEVMNKRLKEEQDLKDFTSFIDSDTQSASPEGDPSAPEGGQVPEAMANAKTETLNNGQTPRMTQPGLPGETAAAIKAMSKIDKSAAAKMYEDFVAHRQKDAEAYTGPDDPRLSQILTGVKGKPGASVSGLPLRHGGTFGLNPPATHYVGGHEGNKQMEYGINEGSSDVEKIPLGEHDVAAEHPERAPHFTAIKEGGKMVGVFTTPDGVQKRVVIGTPDKTPEEMTSNLRNKLAMRAAGQMTHDATFDQQFANPKDADAVLSKLNQNSLAVMMSEIFKAGAGGGAQPTPGSP